MSLQSQGSILDEDSEDVDAAWGAAISKVPDHFMKLRSYGENLLEWKVIASETLPLSYERQMKSHVLDSCPTAPNG